MKKSVKIAIITGICAVVIVGGLALFVHFKLSDIEKNETRQESVEQVAKEAQNILSGKEPHSEEGESTEQHAKESP